MSPAKQGLDQHNLLHLHFPNDCCLCKAELRIKKLEIQLELQEEKKLQYQGSLTDQLRALYSIANREGLYDAADYIKTRLEEKK